MAQLRKNWEDMTTVDFAALESERVIAVLPVGAIEQHGPHLPVSVDAAIISGLVERVAALLPDDLPVTFLPVMPVGKSNEHIFFSGTRTLSADVKDPFLTTSARALRGRHPQARPPEQSWRPAADYGHRRSRFLRSSQNVRRSVELLGRGHAPRTFFHPAKPSTAFTAVARARPR